MKNYLLSIILISIVKGICDILAPKLQGLEKYIRMMGLLCILCTVISPLSTVIQSIDEDFFQNLKDDIINNEESGLKDDYSEILNGYLNNFSVGYVKEEIKTLLEDEFDIPKDEVEIKIETAFVNGELSVSEVVILLSGSSIFKNPYDIEDYVYKLLNCECKVLIK